VEAKRAVPRDVSTPGSSTPTSPASTPVATTSKSIQSGAATAALLSPGLKPPMSSVANKSSGGGVTAAAIVRGGASASSSSSSSSHSHPASSPVASHPPSATLSAPSGKTAGSFLSASLPSTPASTPTAAMTPTSAALKAGARPPSVSKPLIVVSNAVQKASNDYAYNKVFVGGLHYDTRDGTFDFKLFVSVLTQVFDLLMLQLSFGPILRNTERLSKPRLCSIEKHTNQEASGS
jgi:hypothetical protein